MDNYKEYLEERMVGMYESYDSILLEGFKKKQQDEYVKYCKNNFLYYLEYKYNKAEVRYEIKSAETKEEKEKVAKKYAKDFEEWKKRQNKLKINGLFGVVGSILTVNNPVDWMVVMFLFYGNILATFHNDEKKRDEVGINNYKKNKK